MRCRAALFDMDDVLCRYDVAARVRRLADFAGLQPEVVQARIWDSGFLEEADRGGPWTADAFLAEFGRRLGRPIPREDWVEARRIAMTPFPDVLATVAALARRHPVAILTNNDRLVAQSIDNPVPGAAPPLRRPHPGFGRPRPRQARPRLLPRRLHPPLLRPRRHLLHDDREENVEGARAAGLTGHVFRDHAGLARALGEAGLG